MSTVDVSPKVHSDRSTKGPLRRNRRAALVFVIAAAVLAGVGWWATGLLERTIRHHERDELQALLRASSRALTLWFESREHVAQQAAGDPIVQQAMRDLVALSSATPTELRNADAQKRVNARLREIISVTRFADYHLVDIKGRILSAQVTAAVGGNHPPDPGLEDCLRGGPPTVRPPIRDTEGDVRLAVAAPVIIEGEALGAVLLMVDHEQFSATLTVARAGETGETYAFNHDGQMISATRFYDQLRNIGLLDASADSSVLALEIRDPGANLAAGETSTIPSSSRPLTRMAAEAVEGRSGFDTDGYADYRGVSVIGAWLWLDKYDVGIATEMDTSEGFDVRNALRRGLFVILSILALALLGLVAGTHFMTILRRRSQRAESHLRRLGQYTLHRKLGEGGMGAVYAASHALLRRPTALKVMKGNGAHSRTAIERFEREVQACSQLSHPNTVAIYDFGKTEDGEFFYAMEYLDGMDLHALITRHGPISVGHAIHLLIQACGSLEEAHSKNLIHRDIKPSNIVVCERGGLTDTVKVMDFGLVKAVDDDRANLTQSNAFCGTPAFLAPEAIASSRGAGVASDIYALGASAYFLVTGRYPFDRTDVSAVLRAHLEETAHPPSVHQRTVSKDLDDLVMRCLEKDPAERPKDMADLARLLRQCRGHDKWTRELAQAFWDKIEEPGQEMSSGDATLGTIAFELRLH